MTFVPQTNFQVALTLLNAIDGRSVYTTGRTQTLVNICRELARALEEPEPELMRLDWACLYCDLGMLAIPDAILYKPGTLTIAEQQQVRGHVNLSLQLIATYPTPVPIADIVAAHHEQYDGGGYPRGLRGYEVPLLANILHAADTLVALASDRPHRRGLDAMTLAEIIRSERGKQFYPAVVDALETLELPALFATPAGSPKVAKELTVRAS